MLVLVLSAQLGDIPSVSAQLSHTLFGTVTEAGSGEALIGATVVVEGTEGGGVTNIYGFYSLTLPAGRHNLKISYVGYEVQLIETDLQEDQTLNFQLQSRIDHLQEVVVVGEAETQSRLDISTVKITPNTIKAIPTLTGEPDLQQAILAQSGVTSIGEGTTGFNVRGGRIDQNLLMVDEAPLYNSSHLFGMVAVVNTESIRDVTFYKGGIPPKFGGRASSVIDVHLKEGNTQRLSGGVGISPLLSKVRIEAPIVKGKASVFAAGRISLVDLLLGFTEEGAIIPSFYDATVKLNYKISEKNHFYISGYIGRDKMGSEGENDQGVEVRDDFGWGDKLVSLRWNHVFSPRLFSNLTVYGSYYDFTFSTSDSQGGEFSDVQLRSDETLEVQTFIKGISGKYDFTSYLSKNFILNFGVGASKQVFKPLEKGKDRQRAKGQIDYALEYWGYADLEMFPYSRLSARAGLRYSGWWNFGPGYIIEYDDGVPFPGAATSVRSVGPYETIKQYYSPEPRLLINYELGSSMSVQVAYDRLAQYAHLLTNTYGSIPFDSWIGSSYHTKPTYTNQYSLGWKGRWGAINLGTTLYYKEILNLITFRGGTDLFLNPDLTEDIVPAGATSLGAEFDASANLGKFGGNLNYTYSRTRTRTTSDIPDYQLNRGEPFPASFDRPHVLNLVASYGFNEQMALSSKFNFQSGAPVTLPLGKVRNTILYEDQNASRLPANHRLDLSFSWIPKKSLTRKFKSEFVVSVINVYGQKNVFTYLVTSHPREEPAPEFRAPESIEEAIAGVGMHFASPPDPNPELKVRKYSVVSIPFPSFGYNLRF